MQPSYRVLLLLLLALLTGSAAAMGLGNGHLPGKGDCPDPQAAECDPDFDEELALVPHNYDFGGVPVNTEASPMSYALVNTSGVAVQVGAIAISGDGMNVCQAIGCPVIADGEFYLTSDDCSGKTLADQESCELEVGFMPTAEGAFLSGLWVPYTPAGGAMQTIRGKLAGAGFADDSEGFTLSGTVYLFNRPNVGDILDRIRAKVAGTAEERKEVPKKGPKVRTWQPLEGVTVTLDNGLSTQTNELGEYRFDGLAKGVYRVTPASEGHRFLPAVRHVRINGRDREGIQFRARALPATDE